MEGMGGTSTRSFDVGDDHAKFSNSLAPSLGRALALGSVCVGCCGCGFSFRGEVSFHVSPRLPYISQLALAKTKFALHLGNSLRAMKLAFGTQ